MVVNESGGGVYVRMYDVYGWYINLSVVLTCIQVLTKIALALGWIIHIKLE